MFGSISPSILGLQIYHTPIRRKLHEESAEHDCFALAALGPELQPQKLVHLLNDHPRIDAPHISGSN